jgi:hypothetical protein
MTPKYSDVVEHVEELIWDIDRLRAEAEGMEHISKVE